VKMLNHLWVAGLLACFSMTAAADESRYFAIQVVDEATGRGVPLVELETINHLRFVTDSHGMVAIGEPELMGKPVYFTVHSHGYTFPKDGFGYRGKTFDVEVGGKATLKVQRKNIAERLYRVTGGGIYRDSVLLGRPTPLEKPLLNGEVFGCDSVMAAVYRGRLHWFWGDTSKPHYPLGGNFHITGATSSLPQDGGLFPDAGVQLNYFVGADGSVRPMAKMPGDGPTWISSLTVLEDAEGRERMFAGYVKIRNQLESYRWGFVVWNDEEQQFEQVVSFDKKPAMFLEPQTHSFLRQGKNGREYVYFTNPFPLTRVRADPTAFVDPARYEGFTCLQAGTLPEDHQLDRDADGQLRYSWKANTPPLTQKDQTMLVEAGVMKPTETLVDLRDVETGRSVHAHSGSVYWNEYRKRWVLVTVELKGDSSLLGEVWFAEADAPTGPWRYARKIVTHEEYTFYNPKHHPFFDQDGGRVIYFEGTYTHTFSGNFEPTPRYDYNQIMYRLDLSDSAVKLPVAFYDTSGLEGRAPFASKEADGSLSFFALERPSANSVPIVWDGSTLRSGAPNNEAQVLFHAIPANAESPPATTVPLYEFIHEGSGRRVYKMERKWSQPNYRRSIDPVCRAWRISKNSLDNPSVIDGSQRQ